MTHAEKKVRDLEIVELRKQGYSINQLAEMYGFSYGGIQYICKRYGVAGVMSVRKAPHNQHSKRTDEEIQRYIESFMGDAFTYIGGYIDCDHKATIRCNKCGEVFERSMNCIRNKHATCDNCKRIESEAKAKEKAEAEAEAKAIAKAERRELSKQRQAKRKADMETERFLRTRLIECEECGKVFATTRSNTVCCSPECARKRANRIASHRKDSRIKKDKRIDRDITAKKLYDRDGGVCWICGGLCDLTDYVIRDNTIICGDNYPSIDHVVPVCDGGEDSWENVRLAHRYCNSARYWNRSTPPTMRPFTLLMETPVRVAAD